MVPPLSLLESKKELKAISSEFVEYSLANQERADSPRFRSLLKRVDALLRHGCAFAEFEEGPPTRKNGDRRLFSLNDPQIGKAMNSLLGFAAICGEIGYFPLVPAARETYNRLRRYTPTVFDWMELLHPMNGHLQPALDAHGHPELCRLISGLLDTLCLPNMYGGSEQMYEYIFTTPVLTYLVDMWLNLFRYTANPPCDVVTRLTGLMYDLTQHINVENETSRVASDLIVSIVHQRTRNDWRRLCRIISQYGVYLQNAPQSLPYVPMHLLALANILALSPGLPTIACPREDVRTLVRLLDHLVTIRNWTALMVGCTYLKSLWSSPLNTKTIEWAINDGILATLLNALTQCDGALTALQQVARCITDDFNCWRILRAFQRNTAEIMPELKRASELHPVVAEWLTAYIYRAAALDYARVMYKECRERCSYPECAQSLTEPGIKILACKGKDAWYCSERCQRSHWKEKHRHSCLFRAVGRISRRDWVFISVLAITYTQRNIRKIVEESLAVDPNRRHNIALHIDLREPAITHRIKALEEKAPGDAWGARTYICWREWTDDFTADVEFRFALDALLEECEKEAADKEEE